MSITMEKTDFNKLVELIAKLAFGHPIDPRIFLKRIINQANFPHTWNWEVAGAWTGDAKYDAQKIVIWALSKDVNPNDKRFTTLGSILKVLLDEAGFDDAKLIVSIIIIYNLYRDKKLLEKLQVKYQVPSPANTTTTKSEFGPEINWEQPDKTELDGWLEKESYFFDVGFLIQAIQNATSVCRIELSDETILGTGFLIAPKLVLTNYHVIHPENTATKINPSDIVLRFGCFTSTTGDEEKGQTFKLVNDKPILESSPINKLDYALLQVEDSITQATDITKAKCEFDNLPQEKMALNILQHPQGASMKIAISSNAIANISPESGLIQYVTRTSPGSSGSPCFNEDWKVVALHHAQKATHFGSIREGILLSSIYKEIKQYLEQ